MFDRITLIDATGPDTITVNHHRAPTDASIRLMVEMHEKAKAAVLDSMVASDAGVEGVAVLYANPQTMEHTMHVRFRINGQAHSRSVRVDGIDLKLDPIGARKLLRAALLDAIAGALDFKLDPSVAQRR